MSVDWLEARLGDEGVRVIDLRERDAYERGHLPGAVQIGLADLGSTLPPCDNVLLPAADFAERMAGLGIDGHEHVIAYDDQWGLAAARLLWALHRYGHERAGVLDGGWDAWSERALPVTREAPSPKRGDFRARPMPDVHADHAWLSDALGRADLALLDTRTDTEFQAGHLPGAIPWDWLRAVPVGSSSCVRDAEELRAEWSALEVERDREVVVYCRSGMRAAHTYLALRHAGFDRVRLYDGSWQDWSSRPAGSRVGTGGA